MGAFELHTDRLRRETGSSITCTVLLHDTSLRRRITVLSTVDNNGYAIPQTLAYAHLAVTEWNTETAEVDQLLRTGRLMGETFREQGRQVVQNRLFRLRLPLLARYPCKLFGAPWWRLAEIECYEFWADNCLYGTVVEIKNPARRQEAPRPALGRWHYWRRKGISKQQFTALLRAETIAAIPKFAHTIAVIWGWLTSSQLTARALYHTSNIHERDDPATTAM